MSKDEQRRNVDLLRAWETRVRDQAKSFEGVTAQALKLDKEIVENGAKIQDVRTEQARLRSKQAAADHSIQLIWDQQDALGQLFVGLQTALEGKLPMDEHAGGASSMPETRAKSLNMQLDELKRQIEELTCEARKFQATRYSEPLVRVGHVLDAHSSELDAIEERVRAATHRLRGMEISA